MWSLSGRPNQYVVQRRERRNLAKNNSARGIKYKIKESRAGELIFLKTSSRASWLTFSAISSLSPVIHHHYPDLVGQVT